MIARVGRISRVLALWLVASSALCAGRRPVAAEPTTAASQAAKN